MKKREGKREGKREKKKNREMKKKKKKRKKKRKKERKKKRKKDKKREKKGSNKRETGFHAAAWKKQKQKKKENQMCITTPPYNRKWLLPSPHTQQRPRRGIWRSPFPLRNFFHNPHNIPTKKFHQLRSTNILQTYKIHPISSFQNILNPSS